MMQHKFLLFSAICCCLLQVYAGPPPSAKWRPRFSQQSSLSSTTTSSATSGDDAIEKLNQLSQPSAVSDTAKPEPSSQPESTPEPQTSAEPADDESSAEEPTEKEFPEEEPSKEEFSEEESPKKESPAEKAASSKKKSSKSRSRKTANPNDPLNIANLDELKERSKEVIRDLLRNDNANRALTLLTINARDLLKDKVASNIILTHTDLLKQTLSNETAREIFYDLRTDIFKSFVDKETPEKVTFAFDKSVKCLSRKDLPQLLRKRFKILRKILKNDKTVTAMKSVKNAIIEYVKTPDIKTRIAEQFKLLDFGIHFDPNNVMKSLGLPISFFK